MKKNKIEKRIIDGEEYTFEFLSPEESAKFIKQATRPMESISKFEGIRFVPIGESK